MKILHIQMTGPFSEGFCYQENIMPEHHVRLGHQVTMLATCYAWNEGKLEHVNPCKKIMDSGVGLERLQFYSFGIDFLTRKLRWVPCLYMKLVEYAPDFIMLHDVQSLSGYAIRKYMKKHPDVTLIVDCHTDLKNSAKSFLSRYVLHGIIWKHMAHILLPYVTKFYGVLPSRVRFLTEVYKIPREKCELLVMGADDSLINKTIVENSRMKIRKKYDISDTDLLFVTGGKIDSNKFSTFNFLSEIKKMNNSRLKVVVFGSVEEQYQRRLAELCEDGQIVFTGWLSSIDTYELFAAADLVFFAGGHSVLWEQAVGQQKPMICNRWDGTEHLDIGGNVLFVDANNEAEVRESLAIVTNEKEYCKMKKAAQGARAKHFLYSEIAQKVLQ